MMKRTIPLDGVWNFGFEKLPLEQANPKTIPAKEIAIVPGCFDAKAPYYAQRGSALYRRKVTCGGLVRLKIAALGIVGKVFWDGKETGICEHAFSPEIFTFNAGRKGEHELAIAVENITHPREEGGMFLADYDFHCYAGIYDSVTLEELPEYYFDRVQVTPLDLKGNVKIKLVSAGKLPGKYRIAFRFDGGKNTVKTLSGNVCEWTCRVPDPKLWSPESPDMHAIEITMDPEDPKDVLHAEFGIRTIETKKGNILLNGRPLMLIGYNRHDSHPDYGYALPEAMMLEDLKMIKNQGANFIRGSHYPQREKFLNLCDRMGLLVWEEVLGWNNQPVHVRHPKFVRLELEQAVAMVHKSANHPSVIMWGFLNEVYMPEGESPRALVKQLADTIRKEDPSRPITFAFATGWMNNSDTCLDLADILSFNTYPGWYGSWECNQALDIVVPTLKRLADFASKTPDMRKKPLIISEIGAAALIGDHSGIRWSEEYQEELLSLAVNEIFDNPRYSGIAIWQFCDTRTHLDTQGIMKKPRGFNNKGVADWYRNPKLAWRTIQRILAARKFNGYKK